VGPLGAGAWGADQRKRRLIPRAASVGAFDFTGCAGTHICSVEVADSALKLTYQFIRPRTFIKFNGDLTKKQVRLQQFE